MTARIRARRLWPLVALAGVLLAGFILALPGRGLALSHYWGRHPDKERLVIVFPETIPKYTVQRTGKREITVMLPHGYWERDEKPQSGQFGTADLFLNVKVIPDGLVVQTKTDAFGYIQFPLYDRGKLVIDVFKDPIGAKWEPGQRQETPSPAAAKHKPPAPHPPQAPQPVTSSEPPEKQAPPAPEKAGKPELPAPRETPAPVKQPEPTERETSPASPGPESAPPPSEVPEVPETPGSPAQGETPDQADGAKEGQSFESLKEEFEALRKQAAPPAEQTPQPSTTPTPQPGQNRIFSVPYTYRAPIKKQSPDEAEPTQPKQEKPSAPDRNSSLENPDKSTVLAFFEGLPFAPSIAEAAEQAHSVRQSIDPNAAPQEEPARDSQDSQESQDSHDTQDSQDARSAAAPQGQPGETQGPSRMAEPSPPSAGGEAGAGEPADGFTLRARMAPPTTTIPVAVDAPQRLAPPATSTPTASGPTTPAARPSQEPSGDAASASAPSTPSTESVPQATEPASGAEAPSAAAAAPEGTPAPEEQSASATPDKEEATSETAQESEPKGEEKRQATATERVMAEKVGEDPNAPPDFEEVMLTGRAALANEDYQNALDLFEGIKSHPLLPEDLRTDVLFNYADALYALSKSNLRENYAKLTDAYTEAMNSDLESMRVPEALFQLGLLNLKVNSPDQARAYFNILKKRYPDDDRIPMINYYWGEYYYDHKDYQKAADEFQYIVQKYPDNRFVREASVGLARALNKLGYVDQAQEIVEYIEKRWPRFYVEYPPLLEMFGDVNYKAGLLEQAKLDYWTYYNMDPDAEGADVILARLGDIYLELGDMDTAKEVYEMAVQKFPEREGGLIAQMRLAEQGVYDKPTMQDMFSVFDRPYTEKPVEVYEAIVQRYPNSELAPLAQLKLAMWYLWNDRLREALDAAGAFREKFPGNELLESAQDVAMKAFDKLVAQYLREENYVPLVDVWENSPILLSRQDDLAPETRIGLSTAFWKTGAMQQARNLLDPFFMGPAMPKHSENALMLAMSICLDERDWECITDLALRTELWELSPRVREELDYNLALAYENLDQPEKSAPLWAELADREDIDPAQLAYIHYFLAHEARDDQDFRRAYELAQDSLGTFLESREDEQKIKDLLALLMDITRKTGRTREALKWAIEYSRYVNKNDPEWPALRYQMAQLYHKLADSQKWQAILEELVKDKPNSLYGRMAASELQTREIEKNARQFTPSVGQL